MISLKVSVNRRNGNGGFDQLIIEGAAWIDLMQADGGRAARQPISAIQFGRLAFPEGCGNGLLTKIHAVAADGSTVRVVDLVPHIRAGAGVTPQVYMGVLD